MKVETMNISLTPELAAFVRGKVESGLYTSASEVMREALRLLQEHEEGRERQRQKVRELIEERYQQSERGETVDGPEAMARIKTRLQARAKKRA
jgi:antitoxin ParD1/3/4